MQSDGPRQVDRIRPYMVKCHAIAKGEIEESSIACIDYAKPILSPVDLQSGPCFSIDDDGITKVLRLPLWMDGWIVAGRIHVD